MKVDAVRWAIYDFKKVVEKSMENFDNVRRFPQLVVSIAINDNKETYVAMHDTNIDVPIGGNTLIMSNEDGDIRYIDCDNIYTISIEANH